MLGGAIAAVPLEGVSGVLPSEGAHRTVAQHLRNDAGRCDGSALSVSLRQTLDLRPEGEVAVSESAAGPRCEQREGARERLPVCPAYAEAVYPPRRKCHHGDGFGAAQHLPEAPGAGLGDNYFGVMEGRAPPSPQSPRGGEEGAGERPAPRLVRTG